MSSRTRPISHRISSKHVPPLLTDSSAADSNQDPVGVQLAQSAVDSPSDQAPTAAAADSEPAATCVGNYFVLELLDTCEGVSTHRAIHRDTAEEYLCKKIPLEKYREVLAPYWRLDGSEYAEHVEEVVLGAAHAYALIPRHYGDLHNLLSERRRLRESDVRPLFVQVLSALAACHEAGVVLRHVTLRKFVFADAARTRLVLTALETARVLDDDDHLSDKHGCPAYVSPELLCAPSYSGRGADVWGAGVVLFTLLAGRYPFHESHPTALFSKIRRGEYALPAGLSSRARCLVRSLLRADPVTRMRAVDALSHPWLREAARCGGGAAPGDQAVPEWEAPQGEQELFT